MLQLQTRLKYLTTYRGQTCYVKIYYHFNVILNVINVYKANTTFVHQSSALFTIESTKHNPPLSHVLRARLLQRLTIKKIPIDRRINNENKQILQLQNKFFTENTSNKFLSKTQCQCACLIFNLGCYQQFNVTLNMSSKTA